MEKDNKIEFVSYTGKFPNYCTGILTLKIEGKEVVFDPHYYPRKDRPAEDKERSFWEMGCLYNYDGEDFTLVDGGTWNFDKEDISEKYQKYADEIIECFKENVPEHACGGCT